MHKYTYERADYILLWLSAVLRLSKFYI